MSICYMRMNKGRKMRIKQPFSSDHSIPHESSSPLYQFYRGQSTDSEGRTIQQIWDFDLTKKEIEHGYIQWLFPTTAPSDYYKDAPLLTKEDILAFKNDPIVRKNLKKSFEVMLNFYGFEFREDLGQIQRASSFHERKKIWLTPDNHNYKRITRILDCLHTLGFEEEAKAFFFALAELNQDYGNLIVTQGKSSFPYWQNAIKR